jgi:hypothetical protein
LTFSAIQVTPDAVSRVIHLPNGGDDQMTKLRAGIGCRHLNSVAVDREHTGDAPPIMWFNGEQADSMPINVIAAIIAVGRRPLVRGTVAFTGVVTPTGDITALDRGLVEQIRDLSISEYRLGSDRKTTRYALRGRRHRPAGRFHAVDFDGQALCGAEVDFVWEESPWSESSTHRNAHPECIHLAARESATSSRPTSRSV